MFQAHFNWRSAHCFYNCLFKALFQSITSRLNILVANQKRTHLFVPHKWLSIFPSFTWVPIKFPAKAESIMMATYLTHPYEICAVPVREISFICHSLKVTHRYFGCAARVLWVYLKVGASVPHVYCSISRMCLTGTSGVPHAYFGYASRVLRVCHAGAAHTLYRVLLRVISARH